MGICFVFWGGKPPAKGKAVWTSHSDCFPLDGWHFPDLTWEDKPLEVNLVAKEV